MTITTKQLRAISESGGDVRTTSGDKIGSIGQIYVDESTGEPSWVTLRTGFFGMSESFVPLEGATDNGKDIMVNYDKDTVKDAPRIDADRQLSPDEEETLYAHYGMTSGSGGPGQGPGPGLGPGQEGAYVRHQDRRSDDRVGGAAPGRHGEA